MAFFKHTSARHRAETPSCRARNTTIAAAAGVAILGSVAPAQAYAELPAAPAATSWAPASSSLGSQGSYVTPAPVAAQTASSVSP